MIRKEKVLAKYQLKSLYSDLTIHFQPIFSSQDGNIFGYEALTRHTHKSINVKEFFLKAKKDGTIHLLDMICRKNAIKKASEQGIDSYLFINICPETLCYKEHIIGLTDTFAEECGFPKEKIVLEITEQSAIENYELFLKAVNYYRIRGYKIAIDDFGAGFGGPKLLSMIEPDIVKIDRFFINNMGDYFSKAFIEFISSVCKRFNIVVVAEGIENSQQLKEVINLGVDLLQGFYLGKPQEKIKKNEKFDVNGTIRC